MDARASALGFAFLIVSVGTALAEENSFKLNDLAGAYRSPVEFETVQDGFISAEDILEIVPLKETSAYFRTRLHFHNGHTCTLWGIAEVDRSGLVYRSAQEDEDPALSCTLTLKVLQNEINFEDQEGRCRMTHCGARGGFSGSGLERSTRRRITYLDRIRKSRQYQEAVEEYERLLQSRAAQSATPKQP